MKKILCLSIYVMIIISGAIIKEAMSPNNLYITGFIFGCLSLAVLQIYNKLNWKEKIYECK